MSVFDKSLIQHDLGYLPDPIDNAKFQIERYFETVVKSYKYLQSLGGGPYFDKQEYLCKCMDAFMDSLTTSGSLAMDFWKGPMMIVTSYHITKLRTVSQKTIGIEISYSEVGYIQQHYLELWEDNERI